MSFEDLYQSLHGKPPSPESQVRLLKLGNQLNVQENDALWIVILAMDYYDRLFLEVPDLIVKKTKEALNEIQKAHQLTINASVQAIREAEARANASLAESLNRTIPELVRQALAETRSETFEYALALKARKWITIGLTVGIVGLSAVGWVAYDKGKTEGYAEAVPVAGSLNHFVNCDRPGWKIGTTKSGDKICSPFPDSDQETYGWKIGGGE